MPRVPTTREVVRGALVNIILKADQPTGRTVSGSIADVLTRGNHPRGIKVRLTDGRVGRVQSMRTGAVSPTSNEPETGFVPPMRRTAERSESQPPSQVVGLDAYITNGRPRGNWKGAKWKGARQRDAEPAPEPEVHLEQPAQMMGVVTCPVCGTFKGDEAAVAHHVGSHFSE
ncbi:hypothetical protein BO70DRAFT_220537 [Aspergillus heteromorphus CBS 117.55]|uniref:Uncharacterized protein n=1 Tax=Aspergillus heteromorphus CBS 117.55 TaxID=1448321 RepID=A0A317WK60_9EURO|nr:uncharacterized protein BO70DRAFT_220537 [Aspergillus heteromorphus CBS 117.55]PWY86071.1 hypothetical protein BO70DRAFT_220537 [Aspergillus heteromorphus CBS 117.55]